MRIVFFGTPPFAAEILRYLLSRDVEVVAVVTQPDKPKGRSLIPSFSAVKEEIVTHFPQIPVLQPIKAKDPSFLSEIASYAADLFVVVAFGQILSEALLQIPPLGCINVHASLLPKYRGAAPIQRAILAGEKETGVAIQKMVKELDAGDVIEAKKTDIPPDMNAGELQKKLCELAKPLLLSVIEKFKKGKVQYFSQDASKVTFAPKITIEEAEISWGNSAEKIHNHIRAFAPKPGAWCWLNLPKEKKRLKILASKPVAGIGTPGAILSSKEAVVACGEGALELLLVQMEGKKAMTGQEWLRGVSISKIF